MRSMTTVHRRPSATPISSSSRRSLPPRGGGGRRRPPSIAIVRASIDEEGRIGRRETLLGGAATAAAAAAAAAASGAIAVPGKALAATSSPAAPLSLPPLSPETDGAAAFNCPAPREEPVRLGRSELLVTPLAVGAWSWGDKTAYWGYSDAADAEFGRAQCAEAFGAALASGISFLDTAEAYGFGASEELVAAFSKEGGARPVVATKFAPLPWRGRKDVLKGAQRSLERLRLSRLGLYMVHWPGLVPNQTEAFVEGIADVLDAGLAVAGGVSNFKASRVESAVRALKERGHPLASNQVQYSLLYRTPETNDVIAACKANGVSVVAYTPLAQGLLTGKYHPEEGTGEQRSSLPGGPRAATITPARIAEVAPLVSLMRLVGKAHEDKGAPRTPAQVALNWCLCKGALPIAGVKSARQAASAAGSMGWRMTAAEVDELDAVSSRITPGLGFPTESW